MPPGGTASTHLPLNVQLVLELPAGQALQGPGLLPANEAVRSVAVHGDIVGRAVSLCNEDPGHTPEPESFLWATQESPGPAGQLPEATGRRGDGVGCWGGPAPLGMSTRLLWGWGPEDLGREAVTCLEGCSFDMSLVAWSTRRISKPAGKRQAGFARDCVGTGVVLQGPAWDRALERERAGKKG